MRENIKKIMQILLYAILIMIFLGLLVLVTPNMVQETRAQQLIDPPLNVEREHNMSNNWAGYVTTGGGFTSIRGSWIVPQVSPTGISADATWIGIGGISSHDLIQTGTQALVNNNGKVSFQAWYEMLPAISQGDFITASIVKNSGNQWTISLQDITTGQDYQTTVTYTSSLSSAEWIEEMPATARSFIPLDNFGSVKFSDLSTSRDSAELTPAQANAVSMIMVNNLDQALAQPSALGSDGASFTVDRTSSMVTQSVSPLVRIGWRRSGTGYGHGHSRGRFNRGFGQRFED